MTEDRALSALSALAQKQRLRVFRALVVAGEDGLTPGDLSARLRVAPNALSFHLKELAHACLVSVEPRGRHLIYRADYSSMDALIQYLTKHCCAGEATSARHGRIRKLSQEER